MAIKVADLAYCRRQVPDLDRAEQFLIDFGLLPVLAEGGRRYLRTTDPAPYCYVLEQGEAQFLGLAFHARSYADLQAFARAHDRPIEKLDTPWGGWRVRVQEPNGYDVDVVFGIAASPEIPVKRQAMNSGAMPLLRAGELYRLKRGVATPLKRLAHIVLGTPDVRETVDWFLTTLGMISSDDVFAGPDKIQIGSFIRIDSGADFVDHHTIFVARSPRRGLHHISFEAQDIDAVLSDHHFLKKLGKYEHIWGVGRHTLGSQVFDYWADPFGYPHEHWADSDRLNAETLTNIRDARDSMVTQWGEEAPESFRNGVRP